MSFKEKLAILEAAVIAEERAEVAMMCPGSGPIEYDAGQKAVSHLTDTRHVLMSSAQSVESHAAQSLPTHVRCPVCGFDHVRMNAVTTHAREHEDGPVNIMRVTFDTPVAGGSVNPSPRRSGLVIHCECENGHEFDIALANHKGQLEMGVEL